MFKEKKQILVFHIIGSLAVGALIYYLLSPDVLFVKKLDGIIGSTTRFHIDSTSTIFWQIVRNYLPDMAWGYALVFSLAYIMDNNAAQTIKLFWLAFCFSAAMESMQIIPSVPGTFDIFDLVVEFMAEGVAAFIINKIFLQKGDFHNEEKNEMDAGHAVSRGVRGDGAGQRGDRFQR